MTIKKLKNGHVVVIRAKVIHLFYSEKDFKEWAIKQLILAGAMKPIRRVG